MEFVCSENPARFAHYGREVFGLAPTGDVDADALSAIDETRSFFASLGMPLTLAGLDVEEDDIRSSSHAQGEQRRALRQLQEAHHGRRPRDLQDRAVIALAIEVESLRRFGYLVTAPCPFGSGAAPLLRSKTPANWKRTQGSPVPTKSSSQRSRWRWSAGPTPRWRRRSWHLPARPSRAPSSCPPRGCTCRWPRLWRCRRARETGAP